MDDARKFMIFFRSTKNSVRSVPLTTGKRKKNELSGRRSASTTKKRKAFRAVDRCFASIDCGARQMSFGRYGRRGDIPSPDVVRKYNSDKNEHAMDSHQFASLVALRFIFGQHCVIEYDCDEAPMYNFIFIPFTLRRHRTHSVRFDNSPVECVIHLCQRHKHTQTHIDARTRTHTFISHAKSLSIVEKERDKNGHIK